MFVRIATVAFLMGGLGVASAETVLLKDKATVIGKILTEKKDLVVVDLGYTVLPIPRSQIVRVVKDDEVVKETKPTKGKTSPPAATPPPSASQSSDSSELYRMSKGAVAEKSVRELVAQLGEA